MVGTRAKQYSPDYSTPKSSRLGRFVRSVRSLGIDKSAKRSRSQELQSELDIIRPSRAASSSRTQLPRLGSPSPLVLSTTELDLSSKSGETKTDVKMTEKKAVVNGVASYKQVITWINKFDGTLDNYIRFCNDCETAFDAIKPEEYGLLVNYVVNLLHPSTFTFLLGTNITSWSDLKTCLDEHFGIRHNEQLLFREMANMKKKHGEDLFNWYNRLVAKVYEYGKFLKPILDEATLKSRLDQANRYVMDSFILSVGMEYRPLLRNMKTKTIQEAYAALKEMEIQSQKKSGESSDDKMDEMLELLKKSTIKETSFSKPEIRRAENEGVPPINEVNKAIVECQYCNRKGHIAKTCFRLRDDNRRVQRDNGGNNNNGNNSFNRSSNQGRNSFRNNGNSNQNGNGNYNRNNNNNSNWNNNNNSNWNNNNGGYRNNNSNSNWNSNNGGNGNRNSNWNTGNRNNGHFIPNVHATGYYVPVQQPMFQGIDPRVMVASNMNSNGYGYYYPVQDNNVPQLQQSLNNQPQVRAITQGGSDEQRYTVSSPMSYNEQQNA